MPSDMDTRNDIVLDTVTTMEAKDKLLLNEINILPVACAARVLSIALVVRDQPLNRKKVANAEPSARILSCGCGQPFVLAAYPRIGLDEVGDECDNLFGDIEFFLGSLCQPMGLSAVALMTTAKRRSKVAKVAFTRSEVYSEVASL